MTQKEEEEGAQPFNSHERAGCGAEAVVATFLTSLRDILQSPEKTKQLADAITQILKEQ